MNEEIKNYEDAFLQLTRTRLGIVIHEHQMQTFAKTIHDACIKFNCNPKDYLQNLTACPNDSPLLEFLVAGITIGETYFFRDQRQIQVLQDNLLPKLIQLKQQQINPMLRIWSAGCASGEEIYTIVMLLKELVPNLNAWRLNLLGTDININVLQKAMAGCYSEWSMRSIPQYYKQKYFLKDHHRYKIIDEIRNKVNFEYLNLRDDTYPSIINGTNAQDLILCRNVLIYFDSESVAHVMQKFSSSLVDGGYLMLGASDPISMPKNLIFHPREGVLFSRVPAATPQTASPMPPKPAPKLSPAPSIPITINIKPKTSASISKKALLDLLAQAHWQELIDHINNYHGDELKSDFLLSIKAKALASLGKLDQALQICQESLALDATNKYSYLTLSLIMIELNRLDEAEAALRKTLFLDNQFVVGHFQLGLLLLRHKKYQLGLRSLRNALTIVDLQDASQFVAGYQDMNYGQLSGILKHEIELYETTIPRSSNDTAH